jgi:hypothetical protein
MCATSIKIPRSARPIFHFAAIVLSSSSNEEAGEYLWLFDGKVDTAYYRGGGGGVGYGGCQPESSAKVVRSLATDHR